MNRKLYAYRNTNHFGHFLATVFTGGLWIVPWIIFYMSNRNHNDRVDERLHELDQSKRGY